MEKLKGAISIYVNFIENWPGAVAIIWPASVILALVLV